MTFVHPFVAIERLGWTRLDWHAFVTADLSDMRPDVTSAGVPGTNLKLRCGLIVKFVDGWTFDSYMSEVDRMNAILVAVESFPDAREWHATWLLEHGGRSVPWPG